MPTIQGMMITPGTGELVATTKVSTVPLPANSVAITAGDVINALGYVPLNPNSNLSDVASTSTTLHNLELGSIATQSSSNIAVTGGVISGLTDLNGWVPSFVATDNTTLVSGGSGYAKGDTITLSNGVTISVVNVTSGVIVGWQITRRGSTTAIPANPISQVSTSGAGTGASFNLSWAPLAAGLVGGTLASNSGTLMIGGEQPATKFAGSEATFVGVRAGAGFASGDMNTCIGHNAGGLGATQGTITTGGNTFVGNDCGRNISGSPSGNVGVGISAARNVTGSFNTFVGSQAGQGVETAGNTANSNTGIGYQAVGGAGNLTTGASNTGVGDSALWGITTGTNNIAIGSHCSIAMTSGFANVAIGTGALTTMTTGAGNTAVGLNAGYSSNVNDNVFIGQAAAYNITGGSNVLIGSKVASNGTGAANNNVVAGFQAALQLTSGSNNLILGYQAASTTLTTGSGNILIGVSSTTDTATASTSNTLKIQGSGSTAAITGSNLDTTPLIQFPGASIALGATGPTVTSGTGAPVSTQPNGSLYMRTDGTTGARLYVSAGSGTWAAVAGV